MDSFCTAKNVVHNTDCVTRVIIIFFLCNWPVLYVVPPQVSQEASATPMETSATNVSTFTLCVIYTVQCHSS